MAFQYRWGCSKEPCTPATCKNSRWCESDCCLDASKSGRTPPKCPTRSGALSIDLYAMLRNRSFGIRVPIGTPSIAHKRRERAERSRRFHLACVLNVRGHSGSPRSPCCRSTPVRTWTFSNTRLYSPTWCTASISRRPTIRSRVWSNARKFQQGKGNYGPEHFPA